MKESMTQLTIRQTAKADVNRVMEILDIARRYMWSIGNTAQWQKGYHVECFYWANDEDRNQ